MAKRKRNQPVNNSQETENESKEESSGGIETNQHVEDNVGVAEEKESQTQSEERDQTEEDQAQEVEQENVVTDSPETQEVEESLNAESETVNPYVNLFTDYKNYMATPMKNPDVAIKHQYAIYNMFVHALETNDNDVMDKILDAIKEVKVEATTLAMYDYLWERGEKAMNTYLTLGYVFTELADPATRTTKLKEIDLDKAFNTENTTLSPETIEKLKAYFAK